MKFLWLHGYAEYEDDYSTIHTICRADDGKRYDIVSKDLEPYFYAQTEIDHEAVIRCEESKILSYDGKTLFKIFTKRPGDV